MLLIMALKSLKVELINPLQNKTKYRQNQKHPLKLKNLEIH